jgi:hypothetical protein
MGTELFLITTTSCFAAKNTFFFVTLGRCLSLSFRASPNGCFLSSKCQTARTFPISVLFTFLLLGDIKTDVDG